MLIETSGSNQEHDQDKVEKFLQNLMEKELISDCILTENTSQIQVNCNSACNLISEENSTNR